MKRTAMLVALLALLFLVGGALAMSSEDYRLDWYVLLTGGGGGPTDSANYAANYHRPDGQRVIRQHQLRGRPRLLVWCR